MFSEKVHVMNHPLVAHKLTICLLYTSDAADE